MVAHGVSRGCKVPKSTSPERGDRIRSRFFRPGCGLWGISRPIPMADAMGYRLSPASRG
jgi:hypothetical protein